MSDEMALLDQWFRFIGASVEWEALKLVCTSRGAVLGGLLSQPSELIPTAPEWPVSVPTEDHLEEYRKVAGTAGRDIPNLKGRRGIWDYRGNRGLEEGHDMTASLPYPFDPVLTRIFDGKEVLEIGPGNGRQYDRLKGVVQSYCICDISPNALAEPAFADLDGKFLLTDWDQNLPKLFDVVHFWYVLHHVRHDEMQSFFRFVAKNLKPGGLVAFNSPELMNVQGPVGGDGLIHTTYSDPAIVREASAPLEVLVELPVGMKSTGYVFLLRKPL